MPPMHQDLPELRGDSPVSGPTISVIVNTCDRCEELRTLLYALDHQSYRDFEVVVVVGPTRDRSVEMLDEELAGRVVVARCPQFNLSCSRNVGLAHAAGEVVAFIDDDAVPCPTWLAQLAAGYADPEVVGVGGRTYIARPESGALQFLSGRVSLLAEQVDVRLDASEPITSATPEHCWFPRFHGTNMSYRRQALLDIGGFDERFEYLFDDADIGVRMGLAGKRLLQLRDGVVYHVPGSGRNRGKHPYDLNWYCWLRSILYFGFRNGAPVLGWRRCLASSLRTIARFFSQVREAVQFDHMPAELARKARPMLLRGALHGLAQGLLARRRLPGMIAQAGRDLLPFLEPESARRPVMLPWSPWQQRYTGKVEALSEEPLRIALLSVGYPPQDTHGVSRSSHTLARGLVELGHEVHVITSGRSEHASIRDGAYLHEVDGSRRRRYRSFRTLGYHNLAAWLDHSHAVHERVTALGRNHHIQVVDSPLWCLEGMVSCVAGSLPVAVRVVTAMKQIADVHGRQSAENQLLGELEGELLRRCAMVVSNSEATARTLERVYQLDLQAVAHGIVPYGMVPAPDDEVTEPEERPGEEVRVLFVGRLEGRKGILDLFEAIPLVLGQHPRTRFLIAGSDNSAEDGFLAEHGCDYPSYFHKHYRRYRKQVELLGFVDEERLDELYRGCDLFVAPSLYESFGLIYLEAMNQCRPVIGCNAGGPGEIIVDGETGRLVPPQDPQALAEAMMQLVGSAGLRREMGRAGRRRLLEHYSHTTMAAGFVELYRRMIGRH